MRRIIFTLAGAAVLAACGAAGATGTTSRPGSECAGRCRSDAVDDDDIARHRLTNAQGFTLYYFLPEKNSTIGACTGGCLTRLATARGHRDADRSTRGDGHPCARSR